MVSSDTIVGIVGAVILTGAMVAVFYYEADREDPGAGGDIGSGSELFQARFVDHEHADGEPSISEDIALSEDNTWSEGMEVPPYSYGIHVEVEWDDHELQEAGLVGAPSYTIEILDEDGEVVPEGSSSQSPFHYGMDDNRSWPPQMNLTVAADDEEGAQQALDDHMASEAVQATAREWTIQITLDDDGFPADDPTGENVQRTATVQVYYEHYVPELVPTE